MEFGFQGQALQDKFVLNLTGFKRDGTFVEIGSNDPKMINNSWLLEKAYGWRGIMVEYDPKWLPAYKEQRPNSTHIIQDATRVDYRRAFREAQMPREIDYLQIDLEVSNGSTLQTLKNFDESVFPDYKFGVVTFEHDIYHTNYLDTRQVSRNIFERRGYLRVFGNITNNGKNPFEDWYVYPSMVDMKYVERLMKANPADDVNSRKIIYNV